MPNLGLELDINEFIINDLTIIEFDYWWIQLAIIEFTCL